MRKLGKSLVAALFAIALLVACTDQPAPTESSAVDTPTLNWMNNPGAINLRVFRGETHWVNSWTDPNNGLRATHTTVPIGTETDCGLLEEGDPREFQDVGIVNPDDPFSSWIHEVVKGEVFIIVRDLSQDGDCFGAALVAEGWGDFLYHVNDVFGNRPERTNAVAWGFKGHGVLTTPDGGTMIYNGHLRWTATSPNAGKIKVTSVTVNIH